MKFKDSDLAINFSQKRGFSVHRVVLDENYKDWHILLMAIHHTGKYLAFLFHESSNTALIKKFTWGSWNKEDTVVFLHRFIDNVEKEYDPHTEQLELFESK